MVQALALDELSSHPWHRAYCAVTEEPEVSVGDAERSATGFLQWVALVCSNPQFSVRAGMSIGTSYLE
jgi:hypothetical protein